jgi:hypothetical protein
MNLKVYIYPFSCPNFQLFLACCVFLAAWKLYTIVRVFEYVSRVKLYSGIFGPWIHFFLYNKTYNSRTKSNSKLYIYLLLKVFYILWIFFCKSEIKIKYAYLFLQLQTMLSTFNNLIIFKKSLILGP